MGEPLSFSTPLTFGAGVVVKNRFFKSAMSEQLGTASHDPSDGLCRLYRVWAEGGVGLQVTGNVMVDRTALGEPRNVVLDERSDLDAFTRWALAGRAHGTHLCMQLNHPGKQTPAILSPVPVAPSAVPLGGGLEKVFNTPRAMTGDEVAAVIANFARSAALAKKCGFSSVQIHGAHGYLVNQFLSPLHNVRDDAWGGTPEKRRRFVLEVYRAIRAAVGAEFPVGIKLNSADFQRGGFTEAESMDVVDALGAAGMDLVEISGGTYEAPAMTGRKIALSTRAREAYFLDYAEKVRARVKVPLVVTGGFRSGPAMLSALQGGATDMIGMARPLAFRPDFPNRLLADPGASVTLPTRTTGIRTLDRIVSLDVTWYEAQIDRVARGLPVRENLGAWPAVILMAKRMGAHAFRRRRA